MENEIVIHNENDLRSKILTANFSTKSRTNPYAFTEQGIYMPMTVLRSDLCFQFNDDETKELVTICDRFSPFNTRTPPASEKILICFLLPKGNRTRR